MIFQREGANDIQFFFWLPSLRNTCRVNNYNLFIKREGSGVSYQKEQREWEPNKKGAVFRSAPLLSY